MIRNNPDEPRNAPQETDGRLAHFTTGEVFVLYDQQDSQAWLESDSSVSLEEMV